MLARLVFILFLTYTTGTHAVNVDPYENMNRKIFAFNRAFDATFVKPPARLYKTILPPFVRSGIHNAFNNLQMLPTIVNDLLQAQATEAIKDTWRFLINSTFGVFGIFDIASSNFYLPPHYNDLGLTLAEWGDKNSPYIVLPFLGSSTIRDGMGMLFDFSLITPFPYIKSDRLAYGLIMLRLLDVRAELFDIDPLMREALDPYLFVRDAYLQHRNFLINGESEDGSLYVGEQTIDSIP